MGLQVNITLWRFHDEYMENYEEKVYQLVLLKRANYNEAKYNRSLDVHKKLLESVPNPSLVNQLKKKE
jgi:hypothetical protein